MAKLKNLNSELLRLAKEYYARDDLTINSLDDLKKLSSFQLNKLTNWATNTNPNTQARLKGNKYSGNTYNKLKKIY
jgi:hypothetical protein